MWRPIFRCGIVGGVIVFLWTIISWVVLPLHKDSVNNFSNESEILTTINQNAPRDGIYILPSIKTYRTNDKNQTFVLMNIKRKVDFGEKVNPMVWGALTQILAAMLITYLLLKTKSMKYWNQVGFVTISGIIAVLLGIVPSWNWWHFPGQWIFLEAFDLVVGWFLAGIVMAKLIKTKRS